MRVHAVHRPVTGAPLDFFVDAVARTSPARAAYVAGDVGCGGVAVAGAVPAAARRRSSRPARSRARCRWMPSPSALRASAKDVAENIMIVDLVRNDLGRVAVTGTVTVPELLVVRPAPGVWHLVSTVSARVARRAADVGAAGRHVPAGLGHRHAEAPGPPTALAWEQNRRGIYCGTVGLASPVAGCELNVAIRTVEFDAAGDAVLGVGGGITADSDPDAEWEECLHKAAPIVGRRHPAELRG